MKVFMFNVVFSGISHIVMLRNALSAVSLQKFVAIVMTCWIQLKCVEFMQKCVSPDATYWATELKGDE